MLNPELMELRYTTLDVFTDRPFGGNPLAVFCAEQMSEGTLFGV